MLFAFWYYRKVLANNPNAVSIYNGMILGMIFIPITFVNPNMMRVVQYFSLNIMLIVPEIMDIMDARGKQIVKMCCELVLIVLLASNHPYYEFFWQ